MKAAAALLRGISLQDRQLRSKAHTSRFSLHLRSVSASGLSIRLDPDPGGSANGTVITGARIARHCKWIADEFAPERIILFGSRARGRAVAESDVDQPVVMRYRGSSARKAAEILNRVEPEFPVDPIVRSPREIEKRLAMKDPFIAEIVGRGKVLCYAAHA